VSLSIDFKVAWNWVTNSELNSAADSQEEVTDLLCDEKAVINSNIDDTADFDAIGTTSLT
jgi:hypothetical protein